MKLINKYIAPLGIDIEYKVGKNAGDNIDIINSAKHGDIWFHVMNIRLHMLLHLCLLI